AAGRPRCLTLAAPRLADAGGDDRVARRPAHGDAAGGGMSETVARTPRAAWLPRSVWVDVAVLVVLVIIAMLGLAAAYFDASYLLPGLGGTLVGAAVAIGAARLRLGLVLTALLAVGVFFLLGTPLTMPALGLLAVV